MNDLQIEYFLSVAHTLNITKTANEKFVTQPAVSRHIATLETELGVSLFNRENKGLSLTEAGTIFLNYFETHRKNMALITQMVKVNEQEKKRILHIGCGNGWSLNPFLTEIKNKMLKTYPNIEFHLENYPFDQLVHALNEGEIDLAIGIRHNMFELATLEIVELTQIPRILVYSVKDVVASEIENVTPQDFKKHKFLLCNNDNNILGLVSSYFKPYGFVPQIQIVNNMDSVFSNVLNGSGVTIVDQWTERIHHPLLRNIPLESMHKVAVAWRREESNEVSAMFIQELMDYFKKESLE